MRKSYYLLAVTFLFVVLATPAAVMALNPKSIDYMDVEITESGTLAPTAEMQEITLELYLPINYTDLQVQAESYEIKTDYLGNKLIELKWTNTNQPIDYAVRTHVRNYAKHFTSSSLQAAANADVIYTEQGNGVEFTNDVKEAAFPYKRSLDNIAQLTEWTHNEIEYDSFFAGRILNTSEILQQKKGVCVEYATLLTSLLRVSGIPTRYVSGYAYSDVDKTFIGHTWIEVLMEDNSWLPVDPTWMEMGYLDATHITTGDLIENKQTETLRYLNRGGGSIEWTKNQPVFNILETRDKPVHNLQADALQKQFSPEETGYILGTVSADECSLISLRAVSCIDRSGTHVLNILNPDQVMWLCSQREVYWFFQSSGNDYTCPITIYDQENSVSTIEVQISGSKQPGHATIAGPSTVGVGESFVLEAGIDSGFFFYSTLFGKQPVQTLSLRFDKPGTYVFYLYSDGMLGTKTVTVVSTKEFSISLHAPKNVTVNKPFPIVVHINNIAQNASFAKISIEFQGYRINDVVVVEKGTAVDLEYNLTAIKTGQHELTASVYDNTISSYTTNVNVLDEAGPLSFLNGIIQFFANIFNAIIGFLHSIF